MSQPKEAKIQALTDPLLQDFFSCNEIIWIDTVSSNPGLHQLEKQVKILRDESFDAFVAFGGGSAMDVGKILNVVLAPEYIDLSIDQIVDVLPVLEHVHTKELYMLPTTAGTGSEVTPFATIWDYEKKKKLSFSGTSIWPRTVFVDPYLTDTVPLASTISTGLDAINQAAESLWNKNANPITINYSLRSLQLGFSALPALSKGDRNPLARDKMAEASLFAGLAISHTRTALCHSISYPITAHFGIPHGLACAFTMPSVLKHNLKSGDDRFELAAMALTGTSSLQALYEIFDTLNDTMNVRHYVRSKVPSLSTLLELEDEMITPGRADNCLVPVKSIRDIVIESWG